MTRNWGNVIAGCLITIGFGTLIQVNAFARLKGADGGHLPVGERQYVIDSSERYAPVAIEPASHHGDSSHFGGEKRVKVLRDPVRPGAAAKVDERPMKKQKAAAVQYRVVKGPEKAKHLRFGKLAVNGKLAEPRVKFEREHLAIGRAEEPTQAQFFQKISEATNDW